MTGPPRRQAPSAGYSGKGVAEKLGIRAGMRLLVRSAPRPYPLLVADLPPGVEMVGESDDQPVDVVHLFAIGRVELERQLPECRARIRPAGAVWVSWPKKAAGVPTDLTENVVREIALATRLVDVKVCAVDEVWSGLKLVVRLVDRAPAP